MRIQLAARSIEIDEGSPIDISIPLIFNGPQPNAYGVMGAESLPVAAGEMIGDTRLGGSCNFERHTFIPHCNGTHTECVGHIAHERISVRDCLTDSFVIAVLVSVEPELATGTDDSYSTPADVDDLLITKTALAHKLGPAAADRHEALIVRTLPNDDGKLSRKYGDVIPPYFSTDAMNFVLGLGVKHFLTDLPSIDRLYDGGKLSNHRTFWNLRAGSFETTPETRLHSTITELVFVPDDVADGEYLLNLQIAPFMSDASPSRPILFRIL